MSSELAGSVASESRKQKRNQSPGPKRKEKKRCERKTPLKSQFERLQEEVQARSVVGDLVEENWELFARTQRVLQLPCEREQRDLGRAGLFLKLVAKDPDSLFSSLTQLLVACSCGMSSRGENLPEFQKRKERDRRREREREMNQRKWRGESDSAGSSPEDCFGGFQRC